MKILTVIVSYNFMPWLDKCLGSLLDSTHPTDIIVIDNASKDGTAARIREHFPQVRLIESKENLGFGRANNIGLANALEHAYDYVFLVNQDAWADRHAIAEMLQRSYPAETGIISPMHYDGTERELDRGFAEYTKEMDLHPDGNTATFINAAFWLMPIATVQQVGGFSPLFYHYGEDKDYANRLRYHGYNFAINERALAYHDRQSRGNPTDGERFYRSEFIYFLTEYANINYSLPVAFGYSALAALKAALRPKKGLQGAFPSYLKIALKLIMSTPAVLRTRTHNKKLKNDYWKLGCQNS